MLLGDLNPYAVTCHGYKLVEWDYTTHRARWTWACKGAGAHAQECSMLDFVSAPSNLVKP